MRQEYNVMELQDKLCFFKLLTILNLISYPCSCTYSAIRPILLNAELNVLNWLIILWEEKRLLKIFEIIDLCIPIRVRYEFRLCKYCALRRHCFVHNSAEERIYCIIYGIEEIEVAPTLIKGFHQTKCMRGD